MNSIPALYAGACNDQWGYDAPFRGEPLEIPEWGGPCLGPLRAIGDKGIWLSHGLIIICEVLLNKLSVMRVIVKVLGCGPIVRHKDNQCVFKLPCLFKVTYEPADIGVEVVNHPGI